jgi:hypothetical protein
MPPKKFKSLSEFNVFMDEKKSIPLAPSTSTSATSVTSTPKYFHGHFQVTQEVAKGIQEGIYPRISCGGIERTTHYVTPQGNVPIDERGNPFSISNCNGPHNVRRKLGFGTRDTSSSKKQITSIPPIKHYVSLEESGHANFKDFVVTESVLALRNGQSFHGHSRSTLGAGYKSEHFSEESKKKPLKSDLSTNWRK